MAAREALAAQIDQKMLWPREPRRLLDLITKWYGRSKGAGCSTWTQNDMAARKALAAQIDQKMLWPRKKRRLLDLITRCSGRARSAGCSDWSKDAMAAREAPAAWPDHKMIWPRKRRWLLRLIKRCYGRARSVGCSTWSKDAMAARKALAAQPDHKTLLAAQKPPVVSRADSFRIARRSHRAPTASVSRTGRIVRRQLPYCRRSPAFRFFGGAVQFLRAQILLEFGSSRPVPHLWH
jgi:hypothetical protein